jgi:uncharacterized protein YehS (DUF1456 family)
MDNNYILRSLRYALNINDSTMLKIFDLGGYKTNQQELLSFLKPDGDKDLLVCSEDVLRSFLDGLIIHKRGVQENKSGAPKKETPLTNNTILKKIRIALNFKEEDMLATFKLAELNVTKSELTAIFRKQGHKNYKECGDQFIRNFLQGLTLKNRFAE